MAAWPGTGRLGPGCGAQSFWLSPFEQPQEALAAPISATELGRPVGTAGTGAQRAASHLTWRSKRPPRTGGPVGSSSCEPHGNKTHREVGSLP